VNHKLVYGYDQFLLLNSFSGQGLTLVGGNRPSLAKHGFECLRGRGWYKEQPNCEGASLAQTGDFGLDEYSYPIWSLKIANFDELTNLRFVERIVWNGHDVSPYRWLPVWSDDKYLWGSISNTSMPAKLQLDRIQKGGGQVPHSLLEEVEKEWLSFIGEHESDGWIMSGTVSDYLAYGPVCLRECELHYGGVPQEFRDK
jgi:hypothetical protein